MPAPDVSLKDDILYKMHCVNESCTNLSLLKYRDYQGFLVTGQHSGTHWVKWMLSHAMAHHYGVEPPEYYDNGSPKSNRLIGHPKHERVYKHLPRIASTHSRPSFPLQWAWLRRMVKFPPYALVVRRVEDVLLSNYEKWKERYNVSFSTYLRGDPLGNKYICDIWDYMYFMNRWGDVMAHVPDAVCMVRYEDLRADSLTSLRRIAEHFGMDLSQEAFEKGIAMGRKDVMEQYGDPVFSVHAVRHDGAGDTVYSDEDRAFVRMMLDKYLRHDLGYDYFDKPRGYRPLLEMPKKQAA